MTHYAKRLLSRTRRLETALCFSSGEWFDRFGALAMEVDPWKYPEHYQGGKLSASRISTTLPEKEDSEYIMLVWIIA